MMYYAVKSSLLKGIVTVEADEPVQAAARAHIDHPDFDKLRFYPASAGPTQEPGRIEAHGCYVHEIADPNVTELPDDPLMPAVFVSIPTDGY